MRTIKSRESTIPPHYTAILVDGKWIKVSKHPDALYLGNEGVIKMYEVTLPDDAITATFYKSRLGGEFIKVRGQGDHRFWSFAAAETWGREQAATESDTD